MEISTARWKIALYLAGSLIFVAAALLALQHPDGDVLGLQLGLAFFGLCAVVFVWLLIQPQRLLLDDQGFTLLGGFVRSPKMILWTDIDEFFVYRLPRGGKMIGYNYKPGARATLRLAKLNRLFGADGALPKGWPRSPERMAEELNSYRLQATRGEQPTVTPSK